MQDRPRGDQFTPSPEIAPTPGIVDVLRGTVSEPVKTISNKPGQIGQEVEVRLAVDGPGMFGLTDFKDSREWSGIFNHILLSARYADYFAQGLESSGVPVDRQALMDTMIVSHPGRRQWDEAGWYGQAVADRVGPDERWLRANMTNEVLGLRLILDKVPGKVLNLVAALGHGVSGFNLDPVVLDSLEYKLAIYADHRTSQKYEPLHTRMGDFLINNFFYFRQLESQEKKNEVHRTIESIIQSQVRNRLRGNGSLRLQDVDSMVANIGASPISDRLSRVELMRLILEDADTEAMLIKSGLDPDDVEEPEVPMPEWEDDLRRQYVEAAEASIKDAWGTEGADQFQILGRVALRNEHFPENTWWGQYARKLVQSSV
jgi:hypothetical protein